MWLALFLAAALCVSAMEHDVQVVTFATEPERAFFLLRGLEHHKHRRRAVLGEGRTFGGSVHKVEMLRQHLATNATDTDIVLVADGYFGFITAGPREVAARFAAARADVVFAAKEGQGPPEDPAAETRFKHLCSGGFVGRARVLKDILAMDASEYHTDEEFFRAVYRSGRFNIKLDSGKRIFCNLGDHDKDDNGDVLVEDMRFLVRETASFPLVLFGSQAEGMHCFYRTLRRKVSPLVRVSKVDIYPLALKQGETLWFQLTVANANEFALMPQLPYPGWVYDDRTSYATEGFGNDFATFRIGVDYADRTGGVDHPWRWGMGESILTGNEKTVVLGVTMNTCFAGQREFSLGYVFENFFWQVDIKKANVTVSCK